MSAADYGKISRLTDAKRRWQAIEWWLIPMVAHLMNWVTILLIALIVIAVGGGFGGFYPHTYGFGGGGLLLLILVILLVSGRL